MTERVYGSTHVEEVYERLSDVAGVAESICDGVDKPDADGTETPEVTPDDR